MSAVVVYHSTYQEAAEAIDADGFKDSTGRYMTVNEYTGVWIGDTIHTEQDGVSCDVIFTMTIPEEVLTDYEWAEDWKNFRELLVPAEILNQYPRTIFEEE